MRDFKKRKTIFNFIRQKKSDITFLQETHVEPSDTEWGTQWGGKMYHSCKSSQSAGVSILFAKNFEYEILTETKDESGRYLILVIKVEEKVYTLCNVYGPNSDDPEFFLNLIGKIEQIEEQGVLIIGGDFNLVLDPKVDRANSCGNHWKSLDVLEQFIESKDLCDIWRNRNIEAKRFTWHRPISGSASRIDFFLISVAVADSVTSCDIEPSQRSDHSLVNIVLKIDDFKRGPGSWKLNNKWLIDRSYQEEIVNCIEKSLEKTKLCSPEEIWSILKNDCVQTSKRFGKDRAMAKRKEVINLEINKEILLEESLRKPSGDERATLLDSLNKIENKLNDIAKLKTESTVFRSRCQYVREGEKNSKYFFSLEKNNYMAKNMKCLINDKGEIITDQSKILKEQTNFFRKLYEKDNEVDFHCMPNPNDPKLTEIDKDFCDMPLQIDELFDAVMTLRSNKCPGSSGLSAEFYRTFWRHLKQPLYNMYLHSYESELLPFTTRNGIISLLPKKKDQRFVQNKRPLTLQNTDYKILAKALDNRMRMVLPNLIHEDQTGFMKKRNIASNLRKSLDVMEFCRSHQVPAVILSIDMNKCFDRVSYSAIKGALRYFNFGENFIRWIMLFYNQFNVCTQNFGFKSEWFVKGKSVNQGCPISPSVFLLIGEILALKLRNNKVVKGIRIGQTEILISQFADDMDLYLPFEKIVLDEVIRILDDVETNTGLKVSYDKTTLYRIGSIADSDARIFTLRPIQWSNDFVNTLGINLTYHNINSNYDSVLRKLETVAKTWYYRSLTLMGKILVVNTLIGSLFVYKMQVLPPVNDEIIDKAYDIIGKFIWSSKRSKLPLRTLMKPKELGGLGLVDLKAKQTSLIVKWIDVVQHNSQIHAIMQDVLKPYAQTGMLWSANISENDCKLLKIKSNYWYDVLKTWCKINFYEPQNKENVKKQQIWLNSNLKTKKELLWNVKAIQKGIISVEDLLIGNELMSYKQLCDKYGKCVGWIEYAGMLSCIKDKWGFFLRTDNLIDKHKNMLELIYSKNNVQKIYKQLTSSENAMTDSARKWSKLLGTRYDWRIHQQSFKNLYKVTNIMKLRNFQFRLLHNIIFCNNVLYHWKLKDTQMCDFCKNEKQDIVHLMFSCSKIKPIWDRLAIDFKENHNIPVEINCQNVIYNLTHPKAGHVVNFCTLVAKFTIFRCKCEGSIPTIGKIVRDIEELYKIEEFNTYLQNKLNRHIDKWSPVNPDLCLHDPKTDLNNVPEFTTLNW